MTYPLPMDALVERDVLAGLVAERYWALQLYPVLPADTFVAHRLHPFIFGTLRRIHRAGRGQARLETTIGADKRPHVAIDVAGFTETFDTAYPKAGGSGPALALLRDAMAEMAVLWPHRLDEALELRERRRLIGALDARMQATSDIGELDDLHDLADYVAHPEMGPLDRVAETIAAAGVTVMGWLAPRPVMA